MSDKRTTDSQKTKRRLRALIAALLLVIIILILLLLARCNGSTEPQRGNRDPNAAVGQLEGKSPEEIQQALNAIVEEGMFNFAISQGIVFENGEAEGEMNIENIPANHYLMSVQITLDDTGAVVYTSGLIEPNQYIQRARLDVPLDAGVYDATATFTAYDPETEAEEGQAAAKIKIQVLNWEDGAVLQVSPVKGECCEKRNEKVDSLRAVRPLPLGRRHGCFCCAHGRLRLYPANAGGGGTHRL